MTSTYQPTDTTSSSSHHPKMSFEEFKKEFKGEILDPNNDRYNKRLERFCSQTTVELTGKPKYIVGPKNYQDVICAIKFSTRNQDISKDGFAIISGGHWVGENCCKGILIDLNMNLNKVEIIDHTSTQSRKAFKVQGGATWDEVDRVGIEQGLATTSANNCGNGVVATALAGGYGFLAGQFGLGVDNVLEVDIVLADGRYVTANEKKHSELFWAVRGAGPALGCITSITLQAHKQDRQVCMGNLKFMGDRVNEVAQACTKWNQSCGNREAAVIAMTKPIKDQPTILNVHTFYNGNEAEARQKFEVLLQAGPVEQGFSMINYEDANRVLENYAPHNHIEGQGPNQPLAQAGAICTALNERNLKGIMEKFEQIMNENEDFKTSAILIDLYPDLAKNVTKSDSDMCFNGRTRIHPVNILLQFNAKENMKMAQEQAKTLSKLFMDLDPSPNDLVRVPRYAAYTPDLPAKECWRENYHRLRKVKGEVDPQNYFNRWIVVEPDHQKA